MLLPTSTEQINNILYEKSEYVVHSCLIFFHHSVLKIGSQIDKIDNPLGNGFIYYIFFRSYGTVSKKASI